MDLLRWCWDGKREHPGRNWVQLLGKASWGECEAEEGREAGECRFSLSYAHLSREETALDSTANLSRDSKSPTAPIPPGFGEGARIKCRRWRRRRANRRAVKG